jgi:hypothetical protein
VARAEKDLGGTVPESDDLGGGVSIYIQCLLHRAAARRIAMTHLVGVRPEGDTERASKAKVGNLEVALAVNEEVLGLEITVDDTARVAEHEAVDELPRELL